MLKARFVLSACLVLALLGAGWCAATFAGKPAPPPPPPPPAPGKITYAVESKGFFQMNGDGSGKTAVPFALPADAYTPVPSLNLHNGLRWWLVLRQPAGHDVDLWATDGDAWLQLTASGFADRNGTVAHWRFAPNAETPSWSNDGFDSFCSIPMIRWTYNPVTKTNSDVERFIVCLAISAAALETMDVGPQYVDGDPEITHVIVTTTSNVNAFKEHHWSPDATKITFLNYFDNAHPGSDLWVADVSHPSILPVHASDALKLFEKGNTYGVNGPRWSPHGTQPERIAFDCGGKVYIVPPDGSAGLNPSPLTAGAGAFWSPDGKYIAYQAPVYLKGRTSQYDLARIPSGGGSILTLTADIDRSLDKLILGWGE